MLHKPRVSIGLVYGRNILDVRNNCPPVKPQSKRTCANTASTEFGHHAPGVARLNHGSFGSPPMSVLKAQEEIRKSWLAHVTKLR